MSILKVANVHFESTGSNRIDYTGNNVIRIVGDAARLPVGANTNRPSGETGLIRYNTDLGSFEGHNGAAWGAIGGGAAAPGANIITDSVSTTRYLVFANNTTGSFTQANVSTSLTFNPSSGTLSATIFNSTSDANKKTDITTIVGGLETIQSLRGVSFNWKDTGRPSYGLVAQEVEQIIPALVETDEDGNKTLNYDAVISFLVEAVKELSEKVKNG
jgi:hypothetical protein